MKILKIILFMVITATSICFFYYLRKTRIVSSKMKEAYAALDVTAVERVREEKRNLLTRTRGMTPRKGIRRLIESANRLFVYSRLGNVFHGLTFEIWSILVLLAGAMLYFAAMIITKNVLHSLGMSALLLTIIAGAEKLLALWNYKRVDESLIQFMDMAENYNATNGDIISIFYKSSRWLPDPLRTVLEECYYEAKTSGDKTTALYAMVEKIEHPKFKEFVCDMESGMRYCANFSEIIRQSRKNLRQERRAKRERLTMTSELIINMLLVTAAMLWMISKSGGFMMSRSIWELLLYTPVGQVCIAVTVITYILFFYKMLAAER